MLLQESYTLLQALQILGASLMQLNKLLISLWCLLCKEEMMSCHNCAIHLNANINNVAANDKLAQLVSTIGEHKCCSSLT